MTTLQFIETFSGNAAVKNIPIVGFYSNAETLVKIEITRYISNGKKTIQLDVQSYRNRWSKKISKKQMDSAVIKYGLTKGL